MLKDAIVDYINKLISDFFEPPDASQFVISLWAGDVVLKDLVIKSDAVESNFGLPISVTAGKVGKIEIKIPWASLFKSHVEVTVEDLFVLLTPSYTVYNKELEEKFSLLFKNNVIQKLEDGYREFVIKNSGERPASSASGPQSTYMGNLGIQIARNALLKMESIHIRFEDQITIPKQPFSIGFVLKSLYVRTTDDKWNPTYISTCTSIHNQLGTMEGLAIYWNINPALIINGPGDNTGGNAAGQVTGKIERFATPAFYHAMNRMKAMLTESESRSLKYIGPIKAEAKMEQSCGLHEKEKSKIPLFSVQIIVHELALGLSEPQIRDLIQLAETMEFIARNQRFKKYKMGEISSVLKTFKANCRQWWRFAYRCVLEDVRRRRENWSWTHIAQHRRNFKSYIDVYFKKLTERNPTPELNNQVAELEKSLDVFNIILARKIVRVKRQRLQKFQAAHTPKTSWTSYFLGFFSNHSLTAEDQQKIFADGWTPEEKTQIHVAVSPSEAVLAQPQKNYPPDYESLKINFQINKMAFFLSQTIPLPTSTAEKRKNVIMRLEILELTTKLSARPVNSGARFELSLGSIDARGISDKPYIALSKKYKPSSKMLKLVVELHPVDSIVDRKIQLVAQPVQLVYHWKTFQKLVDIFSFQPQIELSELNAAASSTFLKLKSITQSRYNLMMEMHTEMELVVNFVAPYILVPENGELRRNSNVLVIDLGKLHIRNKAKEMTEPQTYSSFSDQTFAIRLNNFEVFLVLHGENYGYKSLPKHHYLLKCSQMSVLVKHSIIEQLHRTHPTLEIEAAVPLLDLVISLGRFTQLINLVATLPLPESNIPWGANPTPKEPSESVSLSESKALVSLSHLKLKVDDPGFDLPHSSNDHLASVTSNHEVSVDSSWILRVQSVKARVKPDTENLLLAFELLGFVGTVKERAYDTNIDIRFGGMTLSIVGHSTPGTSGPLYLINALYNTKTTTPLFEMKMLQVTPFCPRKFLPTFPLTVVINISRIDLIFHQEALSNLILFIEGCIATNESNPLDIQLTQKISEATSKPSTTTTTKMKIDAQLDILTILLSTKSKDIAEIFMHNLQVSFENSPPKQILHVRLNKIAAYPKDSQCPYQRILYVEGDKVFDITLTSIEHTQEMRAPTPDKYDISIKIIAGSLFVFLLPSIINDIAGYIDRFLQISESFKKLQSEALRLPAPTKKSSTSVKIPGDAFKISINLRAEAPRIAFPKDEFSPEAILIDLGLLFLKNELKSSDSQRTQHEVCTFDEINFIFQNATISRIRINFDTQEIMAHVFILNPFSCNCNIRRSVTSMDSPTRYLSVYVELLENIIKIDTEDYKILRHAMDEISKVLESPNVAPTTPAGNSGTGVRKSTQYDNELLRSEAANKELMLSIEMNLDQVDVILFRGLSSLVDKRGAVQRDPLNSFAILSLKHFEGNCKVWNNSDIVAILTLGDISIQDDRKEMSESNKDILKRDLENSPKNNKVSKHKLKPDPFFSMSYQNGTIRNSNENNVRMKLPALSVNMNSEFLFEIFQFFNASTN